MPRISEERREARRAEIVDAARRCFARNGFHQTSMPDIVAEAGLSAGAFYRYFTSKDELIGEIAGEAFAGLAGLVDALLAHDPAPTVAELVTSLIRPVGSGSLTTGGRAVDLDELLRCGVQAWGETLRDDALRARAQAGYAAMSAKVADALARGQAAGRVPVDLVPGDGARIVLALLPGFVLQRTVFAVADPDAFVRAVETLLGPAGASGVTPRTASSSLSPD